MKKIFVTTTQHRKTMSEYYKKNSEKFKQKMKVCPNCKIEKIGTEFYRNSSKTDNRSNWCKECSKEYANKWYQINGARRKKEVRRLVFTHYGNNKLACICCDEKELQFLTIDHVIGLKGKRRERCGIAMYQFLLKNNYPKGYQTLCYNCNMAKGLYEKCPHQK